jgi:hypothetical protein
MITSQGSSDDGKTTLPDNIMTWEDLVDLLSGFLSEADDNSIHGNLDDLKRFVLLIDDARITEPIIKETLTALQVKMVYSDNSDNRKIQNNINILEGLSSFSQDTSSS